MNKYSLRDHKDRLPIVRWAISNQNTYREHSLTYWGEIPYHLKKILYMRIGLNLSLETYAADNLLSNLLSYLFCRSVLTIRNS